MKLPKILPYQKIIFLVFIFVFLFIFTPHTLAFVPQNADNSQPIPPYTQQFIQGLESDSYEKSSFDLTTFHNLAASISISILGSGESNIDMAMGGSFVGKMGSLIVAMYANPPASSREYLADLGHRLKIIKPTYAQGVGFEGLRPILDIWKVFRNIAYLLLAIILVLIGFAIMFRFKINPQTVITIQNALPKIIITLILITFSYAIAGLMIDLIYVGISLLFTLFKPISADLNQKLSANQSIFGLTSSMFGGFWEGFTDVWSTINGFTNDLLRNVQGGKILGFAAGTLGTVVIAVAIAFSVFKLFFNLLISYISILAGVIFSPFLLILEAIPGQKGLNNWLKLMISNIIIFPLIAAIFAIGGLLVNYSGSGTLWVAPFLGGGNPTAYIPTLIGVGVIILAPTIVTSVQKAMGTPGLAGMATGVMAPVAAAWGFTRGVTTGAVQLGQRGYQMTPMAQTRMVEREAKVKARAQELYDSQNPPGTSHK